MCRVHKVSRIRPKLRKSEPSSNQTFAFKSDGETVDRKVSFYFLQMAFSVKKLVKCTWGAKDAMSLKIGGKEFAMQCTVCAELTWDSSPKTAIFYFIAATFPVQHLKLNQLGVK